MSNIIEVKNMDKSFGEIKAVDDLSFRVKQGELFAFLGVNGAGKSTTISVMCGQLKADSGEVTIDGRDIDSGDNEIKRGIGVVFQNTVLDKQLSVEDNLKVRAALYNITGVEYLDRLKWLDDLLDISSFLKRPVGKLSGGQRRRIDIARALIHRPKLLILDEPTTGLDPQTRRTVWEAIKKLQKEDSMTVFLTTHYMEEAAEAGYIVIISKGQIVAEGTPLELKNTYTGDFITIYNGEAHNLEKLNLPMERIPEGYKLEVKNTKDATDLILKHPELFTDYEITKGKMDDVFLAVTGEKGEGGEDYA